MKSLEQIKRTILQHKADISKNYSVKQIGIFGSYVNGKENKTSDLDILVDFIEPVSLFGVVRLENYLSDLLGVKVDLVPKKDLRRELKKSILSEVVYV